MPCVSIFVLKIQTTMNKSYILNLALVYAVVAIVLFLIQTIIGGGIVVTSVMGILSFAVMIGLPIYFIRKQRSAQGGIISFKDAFLTGFLGLLIGGVVSSIFSYLYISFIDPEYVDRLVLSSLEMSQGFMEGAMSTEQMAEVMTEAETSIREGFTPLGMLKSIFYIALFYVVLNLILAAFLKKENTFHTDSTTLDSVH